MISIYWKKRINHYYKINNVFAFAIFYDIYNIHVYKNINDVLCIFTDNLISSNRHQIEYLWEISRVELQDKVNSVKQRKPHRPHENTLFLYTPHRLNCFITIKLTEALERPNRCQLSLPTCP